MTDMGFNIPTYEWERDGAVSRSVCGSSVNKVIFDDEVVSWYIESLCYGLYDLHVRDGSMRDVEYHHRWARELDHVVPPLLTVSVKGSACISL